MLELLYNMCRLCLERIGHHNLFVEPKLVYDVAECAGVRLKPDALFPHTVCDKCLKRIHICKVFRKIVAKSESKLHQLKASGNLPCEEFLMNTKRTQTAEFEGPKQKKKTKHKSTNAQESYSILESEDAATEMMFRAHIVPAKKQMESSQQYLEKSYEQSSNSRKQRRNFSKEKLTKKRKKSIHILTPKSTCEENFIECMKPKLSEESLHMALKNSPQYIIYQKEDLLYTQDNTEINISNCQREKNHKSIHDFAEENMAGNIIDEDAPDTESISVIKSLLDISHEDKPCKQRKKNECIQELLSPKNSCLNIKHEPWWIVRNVRADLEEQEIGEKSNLEKEENKQKSIQENEKMDSYEMLILKKQHRDETEANIVQNHISKPELVISANHHHSIKTEMITSNSEILEVDETRVMHSKSQRHKMVYNNNRTNTEGELEYSIKTRSRRSELNDIGSAFKVKIGVSPRLKQKLARKFIEEISNADDSSFQIHERSTPATTTNYDEGQSDVKVKMNEDQICFSHSKSINESHKQNTLDHHAEMNMFNGRNDKDQDFTVNLKGQIQVVGVKSKNLGKNDFVNETPLPKKIRPQRKVKQEINYTKSKDCTESEFSTLSDSEDSDFKVHLYKKNNRKNNMRSKIINDNSMKIFEDIKENSTLSGDMMSVFETTLDLSGLGDKKAKKVSNSKELVCKKCKPLKIFTNHGEYKIHTYLHMRINRFC